MTDLNQEPSIRNLARDLGLSGKPADAIIEFCLKRISEWVQEAGDVTSIQELEELAANKLQLHFEEFSTDQELDDIIKRYVAMGELAFAGIRRDLNEDTFGTLAERRHITAKASDRYVAFIDCRGQEKHARRFFTRWHEIAHAMTLTNQVELPINRSAKDPEERLMDEIASHLGFYDPLFLPIFREHYGGGHLSYEVIYTVRDAYCPEASFQSTAFRCMRHVQAPMAYIEAKPGYKTAEKQHVDCGQRPLFKGHTPRQKLRVDKRLLSNVAREQSLYIFKNMRVPPTSVIHHAFSTANNEWRTDSEDLSDWETSRGGPLQQRPMLVEAMGTGNSVQALLHFEEA